jgi:hypothetical protein
VPQPQPPIDPVKAWLADWELSTSLRVRRMAGGFTNHVWRFETSESRWLAKLAYQPPSDVANGLRLRRSSRKVLNTGPAPLTRNRELTRLVEYPRQAVAETSGFHKFGIRQLGQHGGTRQ